MEEQAEVRDSIKTVWCKGDKDACNCGTDNREIFLIVERSKGDKKSSKRGTGGREIDSSMAELCSCGKVSNSGGAGGRGRFVDGGRVQRRQGCLQRRNG